MSFYYFIVVIYMCPIIIIALSLALIVLIGGLFLLAYAKKENLGKMTKIASYVAILFGTVVFVGGLICATMCSACNKGKCNKDKIVGLKDLLIFILKIRLQFIITMVNTKCTPIR